MTNKTIKHRSTQTNNHPTSNLKHTQIKHISKQNQNQTQTNPNQQIFLKTHTHDGELCQIGILQSPATSHRDPQSLCSNQSKPTSPIQTKITNHHRRPTTDPNQNHKPPPPTHTKTHEPLLSHSTTLPLKDHKNQHRSTPKLTKTAYPHHHTVAKTTIERRKERESQREV